MAEETKTEEQDLEETEPKDSSDEPKDEEKTYSEEEWSGLLRDKRLAESNRQNAQADAAALRQSAEELRRQNEALQKPKEQDLSEEDAELPVSRRELRDFGKTLTENVTKAITSQREKDKTDAMRDAQAQDATNLSKTHTAKKVGQGLDAKSVLDEGIPYLQTYHRTDYDFALTQPDVASRLYRLAIDKVPTISKRHGVHYRAQLATQLDESGQTPPPGGGAAPTKESSEMDFLMGIISGDITEADVDAMMPSRT